MSETSQEHDEIVSADDVKPIKAGNRDPKWLDLSPLIKYKCQLLYTYKEKDVFFPHNFLPQRLKSEGFF